MIRDRDHRWYEKVLGINIAQLLKPGATWIDMCCGNGRALETFLEQHQADNCELVGIDTCPVSNESGVEFVTSNVREYEHPKPVDLITCVYGLMYIDRKIETLQKWYRQLSEGGHLVVNLDYSTLILEGGEVTEISTLFNSRIKPSETLNVSIHFQKDSRVLRIDEHFEFVCAEESDELDFPCVFTTYRIV